jgi:small subunit ribosomal protein S16
MAVHIRLARHGSKKNPFYRIVVADQRGRRDGRFIERIGTYDPGADPARLHIDRRRLSYWQEQGACPSATLARLLKRHPVAASEAAPS